jgi:prepilin-type processing-associated H-X9-DG protein
MSASCSSRQRTGLSLVEVLVVLGIAVVLLGLSLAGAQAMRQAANRASCANNLHQIGLAFQMYRDTFQGQFPAAARLPSLTPDQPSIAQALQKYVEGERVFRCPSDTQYFKTEGLSYEYPGEFRSGTTLEQLQAQGRSSERIWLLHDFDPVHGNRGSGTGRNFLYADGHVSP